MSFYRLIASGLRPQIVHHHSKLIQSQPTLNVRLMSSDLKPQSSPRSEESGVDGNRASSDSQGGSTMAPRRTTVPNDFERRLLVWMGRYKSVEEIPREIAVETLEKGRNRARIRIANYMMLFTAIGCVIMIISGKRAAERGESVAQMNLDWHRQLRTESAAKEAQSK